MLIRRGISFFFMLVVLSVLSALPQITLASNTAPGREIKVEGAEFKAMQVALGDYLAREEKGAEHASGGAVFSKVDSYDITCIDGGEAYIVKIELNAVVGASILGGSGEYRIDKKTYEILGKHLYR